MKWFGQIRSIYEMGSEKMQYVLDRQTEEITKAIELIQKAHEGQFRKDGVTPYFDHTFGVAKFFQKYACNSTFDLILPVSELDAGTIAALAHDAPEDVKGFDLDKFLDGVYGENRFMFQWQRKHISDMVKAVTKDDNCKSRHEKDVRCYDAINAVGSDAILLKLCDRLHNLSDMTGKETPGLSLAFQRRYIAETFFMLGYFENARNFDVYKDLLKKANTLANKLYS